MPNMRPYAVKVRRSLLPREMLAGVPQAGLLFLFVMTVLFVYLLRVYAAVIPIAVMYLAMRLLSSRDPWLIDIVLENVQQKDLYVP